MKSSSLDSVENWRAVCVKRATVANSSYLPQCEAKYNVRLSSGCFTEGAKFGEATHCGLTKE
jgi:hypothetical protein